MWIDAYYNQEIEKMVFHGNDYPMDQVSLMKLKGGQLVNIDFDACAKVMLSEDKTFFWYKIVPCSDKALYICHQPKCQDMMTEAMVDYQHTSSWEDHLDFFLAETHRQQKKSAVDQLTRVMEMTYEKIIAEDQWKPLLSLLWKSSLSCTNTEELKGQTDFGVLKECQWKEIRIPCKEIFSAVATDFGMCCAFNFDRAEDVYKESVEYMAEMQGLMDRQKELAVDDLGGLPEWWEKGREPSTNNGISKGLTVILDSQTNYLEPSTVGTDYKGFKAYVSPKSEYPWVKDRGFMIGPGNENLIRIDAFKVSADNDIISIKPEDRDCFFPDEYDLKVHKNYTMSNCIYECSIDKISKEIEKQYNSTCTPWFLLPMDNNIKFCNPWLAQKFVEMMSVIIPNTDCPHCLSSCESTSYTVNINTAPFRECSMLNMGISHLCDFNTKLNPAKWSSRVVDQYCDEGETACKTVPDYINAISSNLRRKDRDYMFSKTINNYDSYTDDIAKVSFFFDKPFAVEYKKKASMTIIDFTSQIGGLFGLFIGFSFVSAFEIAYWFIYKLRQQKKNKYKGNDSSNISPINYK